MFFRTIFIFSMLSVLAGIGVAVHYYNSIRLEADKLIYYKPNLTTEIFDRNGKKIANLFEKEHRFYAPFHEIPAQMIEALLAIEDTAFFEHKGVNFEAIIRAIIKDIKAGGMVEGASTITQQLVRNVLLTREKKISRKIKEIVFSLKIDSKLSKEDILERYLNQIYFGHGYHGIKTASLGYFNKDLQALTLKEIAILVGLIKAPSFYDPNKNYEPAIGRANRVLQRMFSLGWIDNKTFEQSMAERPVVYNNTRTRNIAPYVTDYVKKVLKAGFPDLKTGGYKITTTIDLQVHDLAKKSVEYGYENIQKYFDKLKYRDSRKDKIQGAMVVLEPSSGDVLALVGGVDYKKSSFNRATQSKRQIGSSIKPFIYQYAINMGYSGASILSDVGRTYIYRDQNGIKRYWKPKNYGSRYKGTVKLRDALIHSRNLATINLVSDLGFRKVRNELLRYGFKREDVPADLSISLGSMGLSILELSGLYTLFSNYGTIIEPKVISKIENSMLERQIYTSSEKFITQEKQAYLMVDIMRDVVRRGSGTRAYVRGLDIAGKTGTTNKAVDVWFSSFTPEYQAIIWFGNDDNTPIAKRASAGRLATPPVKYFYQNLLQIKPHMKRRFKRPKGIIKSKIDGRWENFTNISKPPEVNTEKPKVDDTILF